MNSLATSLIFCSLLLFHSCNGDDGLLSDTTTALSNYFADTGMTDDEINTLAGIITSGNDMATIEANYMQFVENLPDPNLIIAVNAKVSALQAWKPQLVKFGNSVYKVYIKTLKGKPKKAMDKVYKQVKQGTIDLDSLYTTAKASMAAATFNKIQPKIVTMVNNFANLPANAQFHDLILQAAASMLNSS